LPRLERRAAASSCPSVLKYGGVDFRMAPQVGLESTRKPKFNNTQGHGWHRSTWKAMVERQTDRERIAEIATLALRIDLRGMRDAIAGWRRA
jgi:hypothetical protein